MRKSSHKPRKTTLRRQTYITAAAAVLFFSALTASGIVYAALIIQQLPPLEHFSSRKVNESTKIYDRTGEVLLYEIFDEEKRTVIPFDAIPSSMKRATLAAEDDDFYNQPAFDWKAIIRAFIANIKEGRITQGGSTITQQLVKNVFLTSEKTITRKLKELILAIELESRHSKDEIFSAYLNQIPYGSNAYGVEAASQTFFGKPANELSLAESSLLAALPKAPSYFSPWGEHTQDLFQRQEYILGRMYELKLITKQQLESVENEVLLFKSPSLGSIKAPHFSIAVRQYLIKKYGEEVVRSGGLQVITSLDWELQQAAEEVIAKGVVRNEELYGGTNAALIAQDASTGEILAMVGSRNYFDTEIDGNFNVATQGLRQPGSALKPFVYLVAFEKGFQPQSKVFDVPTEFVSGDPDCPVILTPLSKNNADCFSPENFDGVFRGPVSLAEGLAQSINVPSVKTLYLAGFDEVLKTLSLFGVSTLNERWRYGLSLVLGGGEVKLSELVNAYATLAQDGIHRRQTLIKKIETSSGDVLEKNADNASRVFAEEPVRLVNSILSNIDLRSGLFQSSLGLTVFLGRDVALKTGTTNDYRDAWAIGYTPSLVVGVWAGNNDNTPMHRQGSSILAAVPMWSDFMSRAFNILNPPAEPFVRYQPILQSTKPMLGGDVLFTPTINSVAYPQMHSILYWVDKSNPMGPPPENPSKDSQFLNWEAGLIMWATKNIPGFETYNKPFPYTASFSQSDPLTQESVSIQFLKPSSGSFVVRPLFIQATIRARKGLRRVEFYFNNTLLQKLNVVGNTYSFFYYVIKPLKPQNLIELRAFDIQGNEVTASRIVFSQ
ncbi:MAG TPA: hypothetical protein ENH86_01495 [Candidatus Jorgensenbacteria bacterium]|nr:hypothetical protein [Candidatus Jorgensenbacteria bacterium]